MFGIPSKATMYAVAAGTFALLMAWLRLDARKDERRDARERDYENAKEIEGRIVDSRSDPERLRGFEGRGFRD